MRVYKLDKKHNFIELEPETLDDLWILNLIISESDLVGGKSTRRFRIEGSKDSEKKTIFVKISIEKKELDLSNQMLKLTGIIKFGTPEDYVDLNSHQSLEITLGTKISIEKIQILEYECDLLEKAKGNLLAPKIILLVLDDDVSIIAKVNVRKFDILAEIKSGKSGKMLESNSYRGKYFTEIYEALQRYEKEIVVVAGPGFEKDYFKEFISTKQDIKKFKFTHINSSGLSGLNELLKGGTIKELLSEFVLQKDDELMNNFMIAVAKGNKVSYGYTQVLLDLDKAIIKEIMVTDDFFMKNYNNIRELFFKIDKLKIPSHIIVSESDAGKQLDSLGGIAAFLYY